ncbi:MAG: DUF4347 domain-containing protein [Magnetospirillum sp.]|nr:DUF4347 domain-containing protein [Magnetospirillum sp.]
MTAIANRFGRPPLARALEQRFMYDGAAPATVAATTAAADAAHADAQPEPAPATAATAAATASASADAPHAVVFIDGGLQNAAQLAAAVPAGTEVVILDANGDGIAQITSYLDSHAGLDAVHIVSHGDAGQITLGRDILSGATLAQYAGQLQQWGHDLAPGADVLIYGCDVAKGEIGQHFIAELSATTGTDVAASTDTTGSAAFGGDWTLEAHSGTIDKSALDLGVAGWDGELTAPTIYYGHGFQLYAGTSNSAGTTTGAFDSTDSYGWVKGGYVNTSTMSFTASAASTSTMGNFQLQGNDITGTLTFVGSLVDVNGVTQTGTFTLSGAISRNDKTGNTVDSIYFWSDSSNASNLQESPSNWWFRAAKAPIPPAIRSRSNCPPTTAS